MDRLALKSAIKGVITKALAIKIPLLPLCNLSTLSESKALKHKWLLGLDNRFLEVSTSYEKMTGIHNLVMQQET